MKNTIKNKIVFIKKNIVFLTIFFCILLKLFDIISNNFNVEYSHFLIMLIFIPKINFEEDSDKDGEIKQDSQDEVEVEIEEEDDNNTVSRGAWFSIANSGVKRVGIGCGLIFAAIFLIMALTQLIDPITQLTYITLRDSNGDYIGPNAGQPDNPDGSGSSASGSSGSSSGGPSDEEPDVPSEPGNIISDFIGYITDFFERVVNFLVFGEYKSMPEIVDTKIQDAADEFYKKYYVKIDIGLLMSTLYYDGKIEDEVDTNGDGKPENQILSSRVEYLQDIALLSLTIKESKYVCKKEGTGVDTKYYTEFVSTTEVNDVNPTRSKKVCQENTLTTNLDDPENYIYDYSIEYSKENFFNKLARSEVISKLFPDATTQKQKEQVASEIEASYNIWYIFYGEEDNGVSCVARGNIPAKLLQYMRTPIDVPYKISSRYGAREDPVAKENEPIIVKPHNGIDVVPSANPFIYATAKGTVEEVSYNNEEGNYVVISHDFDGDIYYSAYKHLASGSVLVRVGQAVQIGDQIAKMGATGRVTGAHLHFSFYTLGVTGNKNFYNPENLFSTAVNYEYECSNEIVVGTCTTDGAVAVYANRTRYSFNFLRAIVRTELDYYQQNARLIVDLDTDGLKRLLASTKSSKADNVRKQINFDTKQVLYGDYWLPFSDQVRDQSTIHEVIKLMVSVDPKAYEYVYMGIGLIKGSEYKTFSYKSAKEMFETFSGNKFIQIKIAIDRLIASNSYLDNIFRTFDTDSEYIIQPNDTIASIANRFSTSEEQLRNATNISNINFAVGQAIKFYDKELIIKLVAQLMIKGVKDVDAFSYKAYSNYLSYKDDPESVISTFLNDCLIIPKPDWADCYTFEDKGKCKSNLNKYRAKSVELVNEAPTAIGKRVLLYGLSLWGKVRYCGWCSESSGGVSKTTGIPNCSAEGTSKYKWSFLTRCSNSFPISLWHYEGFNPKWSKIHNYNYADVENPTAAMGNYTAGIAGLDCEGFVTWTMNQAFDTYKGKGGGFKSVMGGACNVETDYTTAHVFGIGNFKIQGIANELTPGDVVCDNDNKSNAKLSIPTGRHVMIYMGYDDLDGDGMANNSDRLYFVHSSGGEMGVSMTSLKANDSYFNHYKSYYTYK